MEVPGIDDELEVEGATDSSASSGSGGMNDVPPEPPIFPGNDENVTDDAGADLQVGPQRSPTPLRYNVPFVYGELDPIVYILAWLDAHAHPAEYEGKTRAEQTAHFITKCVLRQTENSISAGEWDGFFIALKQAALRVNRDAAREALVEVAEAVKEDVIETLVQRRGDSREQLAVVLGVTGGLHNASA